MTDEELLFLVTERLKDRRIRVWVDDLGAFHFQAAEAEGHEFRVEVMA